MANCLCNVLKSIWTCLLGSLRIILFLACLIFAIFMLGVLAIIYNQSKNDVQFPLLQVSYSEILQTILLLIISLTGCYGAFFKHHPSIKFFTWTTSIAVAIMILSLISTSPESLRKDNNKYFAEMKDKMDKYDWHPTSESAETKSWDILQTSLRCCGIKGPNDWDDYRPKYVPSMRYPQSCCPLEHLDVDLYCSRDYFHDTGCLDGVRVIEKLVIVVNVYITGILLILCVISCVVGHLDFASREHISSPNHMESGVHGLQPTSNIYYQGGSVYVRQPPFNESYIAPSSNRNPLPQIYPNAYDIDKKTQLPASPPSYGSAI